jgi:uncharacterized membrane protein
MASLKNHLQNKFLAGTLAAIPLAVTAFILWYVDAKLRELFGVKVPGLGLPAALLGIYVLGVFVTSLVGRYLLRATDFLLARMPGLRDLYRTWKQIAVSPDPDTGLLARVALVPDESGKLRLLGFTSGRPIEGSADTLCVFLPGTPNPTAGRLAFVRLNECLFLPVGAHEALKFVISGGNYVPPGVGRAVAQAAATEGKPKES